MYVFKSIKDCTKKYCTFSFYFGNAVAQFINNIIYDKTKVFLAKVENNFYLKATESVTIAY